MEILRTPDDRFDDLPGFPFRPHYVDAPIDILGENLAGVEADATLRIHHLDEGPSDGPIVLLLHGEPTWSYLYRHMIPALVEAGLRVIAPDLVGFGRSDKPVRTDDHSYARQVAWMHSALFDTLDLDEVTLFGQDWGALIGLRLVAENPERFARVVIGNGGLPSGDQKLTDAFESWRDFALTTENFPVGAIINGGCTTDLEPDVIAAYDAPYPDDRYKAGPRVYPALVPISPDDPAAAANRAAWDTLGRFDKPFLTAFSDADPITAGGHRALQRHISGAADRDHPTIEGAGHFLQEDRGPELARVIADFIANT